MNPQLTDGEVPGTMYGLSEKGWMDSDIFENWFTHHFLAHIPSTRPILLLLDGHSTHYNPAFIKKAAHEKVIVFCLPPNITHLTQPLDMGIFGPLKHIGTKNAPSICQSIQEKLSLSMSS